MSREKQIEEMAKYLVGGICWTELDDGEVAVDADRTAEILYNAGYRKSSVVAEEIFEEIDTIIIKHLNDAIKSKSLTAELTIDYMELDIDKLKKKYTEGGK